MKDIGFLIGNENNLPKKKNKNSFYITKDSGKIILGNNVWNSKHNANINMNLKQEKDLEFLNLKELPFDSVSFSYPITKYEITFDIKGATLSNTQKYIEYGLNYSTIIFPNYENFNIIKCEIYVGGIKKNECFNRATNEIFINNVKGNIHIMLICEEKTLEHKYITKDNFIKDYGNKIKVSQEGDYVVLTVDGNNSFFWVTSNSYFPEATNCKLILDDLIILNEKGRKVRLPNFLGFWKDVDSFLIHKNYDIKNNYTPSTNSSIYSEGRVSFGSGFFYSGVINGRITIKMKAKLIYT